MINVMTRRRIRNAANAMYTACLEGKESDGCHPTTSKPAISKTGNGEWRNGERGTGNGESLK